jgi:hypothetical protein
MKNTDADNIVSLTQWKARMSQINMAASKGWNIMPIGLSADEDYGYFYIYEPLLTGYSACSCFSYKSLRDLVGEGTEKYGTPAQISDMVGNAVLHIIDNKLEDKATLESMFVGSVINFANTKTAHISVSHPSRIRNFGNLIYRLGNGRVIMRPMSMIANGNSILRPAEVAMAVVAHMLEDKRNHPDYFDGIDFESVLSRIVETYPELASELQPKR